MPSLLDIPPELRTIIICLVLCDPRKPANSHSSSDNIQIQPRGPLFSYSEQPHHFPSRHTALLLTNRQLFVETREILKRQGPKLPWILDIHVMNDYDMSATWLSVPYITNRVHEVKVDIRLFGHIMASAQASKLRGCGGRLGFHWSFYRILERVLLYEPKRAKSSSCNSTCEDGGMAIGVLTLDIQSAETKWPLPPASIDYGKWRNRQRAFDCPGRNDPPEDMALDELLPYRTRPEWLAKYLHWEISAIVSMCYHRARYGGILYEHIGMIRIVVDGEVTEVDLGDQLTKMRFTDPGETLGHIDREVRLSTFWEWKKQTLARRQRLGFPVSWPNDPELNLAEHQEHSVR